MSRRATISDTLRGLIAANAAFKTVKLVSKLVEKNPIDVKQADMPAIKIIMPEEAIEYHVGLRAMFRIRPEIHLYMLEWNADSTVAEEGILEVLRNILGKEYDISQTAVNIDILKVFKENSTYPLVHYRLLCEIEYEESIASV